MLVRKEYRATKQENAERYFTCAWCGARGEVVVRAVGQSAWQREDLLGAHNPIQAASDEADRELMLDAERALALVRCPTCGRRARGAVFWACVRVGFWAALTLGLAVLSGGHDGNALWGALGCGGVTTFFGYREVARARRASRAMFTRLTPGTPPPAPPKRKPRPQLPVARAVTAPPAPPPAPPPEIKAPPPPLPPSPDGKPRFLRND